MVGDTTSKVRTFGAAPVFFTAIATILGAILFLRFGFAVGHVGFFGVLIIILMGHAVTIPTAMALAEIATNQKVEGGGEYYIISRSFGLVIGSTIGIALYLSQAISVAFYVMAFSEAFVPLFQWLGTTFSLPGWLDWIFQQKQTIGIPALLLLTYVMLTKGASLGIKMLYAVVVILAISLAAFFLGKTDYDQSSFFNPHQKIEKTIGNNQGLKIDDTLVVDNISSEVDSSVTSRSEGGDSSDFPAIGFFVVFAIIFPAFTGMTAGVGLSGDLKNPGKAIPLGTMAATVFGMVVYILIAWKMAVSAPPSELVDTNQLVMAKIAVQGWWLIPLGLAAATISSALGSIMVAPRTLQAIARDRIFPAVKINHWLSRGKGERDEPVNASVITVVIAMIFILMGAIDSVARIISMFFMVTYGSLCLISFFNHFAADPSYRPKFKSRWYLSLGGALSCIVLMFLMSPLYALLAIVMISALYIAVNSFNRDKNSLAVIFQGVIFQLSRQVQVFMQKTDKEAIKSWRPSAIALSEESFKRFSAFDLLRWISHRHGFGTYIHYIKGYLSQESHMEAIKAKSELIKMANLSKSNVYVDTLVSPSLTSIVAQVIQLPGIAGTENNLLIFEFHHEHRDNLPEIIKDFRLIQSVHFDIVVLRSTDRGFGFKKSIHVWITPYDFENANLMILLAYILSGHKEWSQATINIIAVFPEESIKEERERLLELIHTGQLPISPKNVEFITKKPQTSIKEIINDRSRNADLTIVGVAGKLIDHSGIQVFDGYEDIGNMVYVTSAETKEIK